MKIGTVVICPPCGENVALATKRGLLSKDIFLTTPHRPYGALPPQVGKKTALGFTLIELLVVVLIIGILAAVALPQYQKAVLKARLYRGITLVETIYQAQQTYYLEHGNFAKSFNDLDIQAPLNGCEEGGDAFTLKYTCDFGTLVLNYSFTNVQFIDSTLQITYMRFITESSKFNNKAGDRYCSSKPQNNIGREICQNMGGTFSWENENWAHYKLNI